MEFLSPFNLFLTLSITLSFLVPLFNYYRNRNQTKKLPPGPWKLPLIGNIHQLVGGGLPHHILRNLATKHGPLLHLQLGELPLVVISSPRLAKEVLKNRDPVFAGRPEVLAFKIMYYDAKDVASLTYGDYFIQMRRICEHEMLNAKNARLLAPVRLAEGKRMISLVRSSAGKSTNMSERISQYTMSVICRASFGRLSKDQDKFVQLINEFVDLASGFDLGDLFPSYSIVRFFSGLMPKLLKIHGRIDTFLEDMINEHMKNMASSKRGSGEDGEEDLIDNLLKFKDSSSNLKFPFTNTNIKALIANVFTAGTESSTTTTVWAMSELVRNPHVMAKVQAELRQAFGGKESIDEVGIHDLKYLNLVIKETLRLHPPAPLLAPRECMKDCEVDGYTISAKTKVMINAWAIGRDPTVWSDPESFVPERFENTNIDFTGNNFELLPFGSGKRICPGITIGIANIKLPLALLLHYFDWSLPGGVKVQNLDMSEKFGAAARRKTNLCLIPTLRSAFADLF